MSDDLITEEGNELIRHECPNCGKGFDVAENKWQNEGLICPYCGADSEE